jgi:hypothetical protein
VRCGTSVAGEWEVEYTDDFEEWYGTLNDRDRALVASRLDKLEERGPRLADGLVKKIVTSDYANMRELICGSSIRVLFAFDPESTCFVILGGSKRGAWKKWYNENVPRADELYEKHLDELKKRRGKK